MKNNYSGIYILARTPPPPLGGGGGKFRKNREIHPGAGARKIGRLRMLGTFYTYILEPKPEKLDGSLHHILYIHPGAGARKIGRLVCYILNIHPGAGARKLDGSLCHILYIDPGAGAQKIGRLCMPLFIYKSWSRNPSKKKMNKCK